MAEGKPVATIVLRGLAVLSYFIAAIVMFLSNQTVDKYTYRFIARYNDWNGLTYFAIANCIGFVYNLSIISCIPSGSPLWKTIIALDVFVNLGMGTSLGVAWQTYALIKCGNIHWGWAPMCGVVPFFCRKVVGSLATSSLGFFSSVVLLILTLQVSVDPLLIGA